MEISAEAGSPRTHTRASSSANAGSGEMSKRGALSGEALNASNAFREPS
jgi:hypothetical protein